MAPLRPALLLALAAAAAAQEPSPFFWSPEKDAGRLELPDPLGGWTRQGPFECTVRLALEEGPRPRRDPALGYWEAWELERRAREAAILAKVKALLPGERPSDWKLVPLLGWRDGEPEQRPPIRGREVAFLARYAQARAQVEAELEKAEAARQRTFPAWLNGARRDVRLEPNRDRSLGLAPRAGENRLEVLDPATGRSETRSWWYEAASGPRLQVMCRSGESIRVLEPGGALSQPRDDYRKGAPGPGTYTVLWGGWRATWHRWWQAEEAAPVEVAVDVLLDGGTDRERRWSFRRLCLPGAGETPLGTFDVEE